MKLRNKLLYSVALVAMGSIPFSLFDGTARAVYAPDGSVQNGVTGGWDITDSGVCVTGIKSDGTLVKDETKLSRPDCLTTLFPNDADLTSSAACIADTDVNGGSHYWTNICLANDGTPVSLDDLDRTATNCNKRAIALGFTSGALTSKCTAAWVYTGTNDDGAPGFCYAPVEVTATYPNSAACLAANTGGTGYSWNSTLNACTFSYGISGTNGRISNNAWVATMAKNGVTTSATAHGPFDFNALTQGECLYAGGSWSTGTTKNGTTTLAADTAVIANVTGTRAGCLECHNSVSQYNSYAERWKDTYLMTGHKNMLRKVTPGMNWAGPDGVIYTEAAGGQVLDFVTGQVTGTYGTASLWYLFGDWMAPAPDALDTVVSLDGHQAKYNGGNPYSCAACHATGWSNAAAGLCSPFSSQTTQANCETAGGTWLASTGIQGTVGAEPLASFPGLTSGITGQWDRDGIICSRCHATTFPTVNETGFATEEECLAAGFTWSSTSNTCASTGSHNNETAIQGQHVNNVCFGCHQSIAKTDNHTGLNADEGNPAANIPVKDSDSGAAYVPEYSGHTLGNEFLNSPHARYSGSITPNRLGKYDLEDNDMAHYDSAFNGMVCRAGNTVGSGSILKTYVDPADGSAEIIKNSADCTTAGGYWVAAGSDVTTTQGSCVTCHDVHQSTVPAVGAEEPFVRECTTCHVDDPDSYPEATPIAAFNHPAGPGTPLEDQDTEPAKPCEVCHMPKSTSGGFPQHVWRINVDANYSTYPTSEEFYAPTGAQKNANTAPDDQGYDAVWVDLDNACGKCHGGSGGEDAAVGGPYFSKPQLAVAAGSMHDTEEAPTGNCSVCHDGVNYPTFVHPTTRPSLYEQRRGQGLPGSCQNCHTEPPHSEEATLPTVAEGCQGCHGTSGAAHFFPLSSSRENAEEQHEIGAVAPNATCGVECHSSRTTAARYHHPVGAGTPGAPGTGTCEVCHANARRGVVPTTNQACSACHGANGTAHKFPMKSTFFMDKADDMHSRDFTDPYPTNCSNIDCHGPQTIAHPTGTGTPNPASCNACHGRTRPGVAPTAKEACIACHAKGGTAKHRFTAAQISTFAAVIHSGGPAPSTTCTDCHDGNSIAQMNHPLATWLFPTCTTCHVRQGFTPSPAMACNRCHGGSLGRDHTANGAPYLPDSYLRAASDTIHVH